MHVGPGVPLEEHPVLLTTEISLQLQIPKFSKFIFMNVCEYTRMQVPAKARVGSSGG